MKILNNKKVIWITSMLVIILVCLIVFIVHKSYATELENDVEVEPNSDLTYYLDIKSDGADKYGVKSSDNLIADVKSNYIYVSDKLPQGLTFTGFVTTDDGTIGAVQRGNSLISCPGKVIDDTNEESTTEGSWNSSNTEYTYHGLHYNKNTNIVTFKVEKLMAGCVLTVGIKTKTPSTIDDPETTVVEKRRDFYNFGEAKEGLLSINSNTVHVYMGKESEETHSVTYSFTGTVPSGVVVPSVQNYTEGSSVAVAKSPDVTGYTFSGWTTNDVTVSDNVFEMPNSDVTFTGSFTEINKKTVTYNISGTTPDSYVIPTVKSYVPGETVSVDSLKSGDIINGYRFLGWTTSNVTVTDNEFTMPNSNVTFTGSFEEVKYKVIYKFYDTVVPPNSDNLLPETKSYKPGATVSLENEPTASGYKFLGWYHGDNFEMPEENVIIYGEWKEEAGTFSPSITKQIVDKKNNYKTGDEIEFKITVTNNSNFAIKDVRVKEEGGVFESKDNYTILSDHVAEVSSISSNSSAILYAKYTVKDSDIGIKKNTAYISGALADNNYVLEDKEYKSEVSYMIGSKIVITNTVRGNMADTDEYFKYKVIINGTSGNKYTISGQDSSITYNGTSVTPSTTYIVGSDNYVYLKHGQSVTIGEGSGDNPIVSGITYSITLEGATSYETYINGSSTNNKSTGNLTTSGTNTINQVNYLNEKSETILTGVSLRNNIIFIIVILIISGISVFIVRKRIDMKFKFK